MIKKIALLIPVVAVVLLFAGCGKGEGDSIAEAYPELPSDTVCRYADQDEVLAMLKHGTGVVLFSWTECPWCHRYITYVNEVAAKQGIEVLVYDIYEDREGETEYYKEVCEIIGPELEKADAFDASGYTRIYVPDLIVMGKGEIIGHDNETSMIEGPFEDINKSIDEFWASEGENGQTNEYSLRKRLSGWFCDVCGYLQEIESRGCTSCPTK